MMKLNSSSSWIIIYVFLFFVTSTIKAHEFTKCDPPVEDQLKVNAVAFSPDPVEPGKPLVVKISGGPTDVEVTGGKATLSVLLFGTKVINIDFDVCTEFGVKCPVAKGENWNGAITYDIPSEIPSGISATAQVNIKDAAGNDLSCFQMDVKTGSDNDVSYFSQVIRRLRAISSALLW